jgi:DNA-binding CsgD family transcriptional regulator
MGRALSLLRGSHRPGSGGLMLIFGQAGIGKTALLTDIRTQAARMEVRVAGGTCDRTEQAGPGGPVIAMLRTGRAPLVTATVYERIVRMAGAPLLLADRIAGALEPVAADGPVLLTLDDVQWADRVSRFLVRSLVSRLAGLPVVWVLAGRDGLGAGLTGRDLARAEHFRLAPLSTPDLAAIAQDRLGRVPDERLRRFLAATDGNPLLATRILDNVARSAARGEPDSVPSEFAAGIAHRLAGLTEEAGELVRLIAVAGRPVTVPDIAALLPGAPEHAVTVAIDSGLIIAAGHTLAFRHEIVREAVYHTVPGDQARRLHREFATYYLATDPLIAASHARTIAVPGDLATARILISAAEKLADRSAGDAGELAALAFRTVRPGQAEWLELSRRCLAVLCRTERATDAITVADLILAHTDDGNLAGEVETEAARALWLTGRIDELVTRTERILNQANLDPAVAARLRAAHALAGTRLTSDDVAAKEAAAAVEEARATGDREALALGLQAAGEAAKNSAHHRDALRHFRALRTLAGLSSLAEEITELQFLDRYDHAQALLDHARTDSRDATLLPALHAAQVWQDFALGRLDDADAGGQGLIELGGRLGDDVCTVHATVIRISVSLLRGEVETAATQLRLAELTGAEDLRRPGLTVVRGWLAAAHGELGQAIDTLHPVLAAATTSTTTSSTTSTMSCDHEPLWPCWIGLFFELGTAAGDHDFADAVTEIAETSAARNPGVASFEGIALNLRGRGEHDLDLVARSADVLARSPGSLLRGFGADTYGRALLATGHRSAALDQLDRAWDEYHRMDARVCRARVQHTMRDAGARREKWSAAIPKPAPGRSPLTEAERRVAALITAGHTNKAAASELGVSINTVGTHLRAIFAKLGIRSRVQLTNVLHEQPVSRPHRPVRSGHGGGGGARGRSR